jgi:hypothetical protein
MVRGSHIEPTKKARANLLSKIDRKISEGKKTIDAFHRNPAAKRNNESTFAMTVFEIDRIVRGWANSFRFVGNRLVFCQLDNQIHEKIAKFETWVSELRSDDSPARSRILGIYQINDVEYKSLEGFLTADKRPEPLPFLSKRRKPPHTLLTKQAL